MAFGFFNIEEPGLAYSQRKSYAAGAGLSTDPNDNSAPIAGEWLELGTDQTLDRSTLNGVALVAVAAPVLVDKSRTDVQSGGKLTVLMHPGAICQTAAFATLGKDGTTAVDYAVGDALGLCQYIDADGNTRQGLYPLANAAAIGTLANPGVSTNAGAVQQVNWFNDAVDTEGAAFARVLRAPYSISGVGVNAGTGFGGSAQVIDIQIL